MADLKNKSLIVAKGFLFLLLGLLGGALLLWERPSLRTAALLGVCVWGFARFYYFAFYVIEHYVDGGYRFAGLASFVVWCVRGRTSSASRSGACPRDGSIGTSGATSRREEAADAPSE